MANISIALPPEMNELVQAAVASGDYATDSEVVQEALREWQMRRPLPQGEVVNFQNLWTEGIESGPGRLGSMDAIRREARRRRASAPSVSD